MGFNSGFKGLILEKLHVWYGLDSTVQEWVQLIFVDVVMNLHIL